MEKYKIHQKAYEIDFSKINEGYLSSGEICLADTIGKAKSILLDRIKYESWKLKYSDDDITFTNIPVVRRKTSDLHIFEGSPVPMWRINEILSERERFKKFDVILNDESIKYCYIRKGSYYRPNSCGYTDMIHRAGVYTKEEAVSEGKFCRDITIQPIVISDHNEMINKEINDLKSRLLS